MFKDKKTKRVRREEPKPAIPSEFFNIFLSLQEKLNTPMFNGGFATLLAKMENIESSQEKTARLVEQHHSLISDPDEGLFSRLQRVEGTHEREQQKNLSAQVQLGEDIVKLEHGISEMFKKLDDVTKLRAEIQQLVEWKNDLSKKLWILIPTSVALFGKIVWDIVSVHFVLK